jgi:RHS repeat-associated protein
LLTLPNGIEVTYDYDDASQLTGLTYKQGTTTLGTLTYSYDLAGNRTAVGGTWARTNLPAALSSVTYDAANQIATWGSTSFTYDANGNLTSDGVRSYTWDARNQLGSLSGGVSASFQYDGLGRRRGKTIASTSTGFLYDGLNAVQELTSGSPSANIVAGLVLDEWFARSDGGGTSYFLGDAIGSTAALADSAGAVQTAYTYEPFGGFSTSGPGTSSPSAFTGREADGSGLFFYRARYYHPQLQRFVSEDPLSFGAGDTNVYSYVSNRPTKYSDPNGRQTIVGGVGFSGVFGQGVESSVGVAVNPGWGGCPGVGQFASGGGGQGANLGVDAFIGYVGGDFRNVAGQTTNVNVVIGPISITVMLHPTNGTQVGATMGVGPGLMPLQMSGTHANTVASGYAPNCDDDEDGDVSRILWKKGNGVTSC